MGVWSNGRKNIDCFEGVRGQVFFSIFLFWGQTQIIITLFLLRRSYWFFFPRLIKCTYLKISKSSFLFFFASYIVLNVKCAKSSIFTSLAVQSNAKNQNPKISLGDLRGRPSWNTRYHLIVLLSSRFFSYYDWHLAPKGKKQTQTWPLTPLKQSIFLRPFDHTPANFGPSATFSKRLLPVARREDLLVAGGLGRLSTQFSTKI